MYRLLGISGLSSTFALWSMANVFTSIALLGSIGVLFQSSILFLIFLIAAKAKNLNPNFTESRKVLPHAIFRMLGLCLLTASLMFVKVGIVDTIIACNVLFVIFVLAPRAGEKAKPILLIPLMTTIFGISLVCLTGTSSSTDSSFTFDLKLLLPLSAMITLAISLFLWRKCSEGIAPTKYITYMHGWVSILSIPFIALLSIANISESNFTPTAIQIGFIFIALVTGSIGDMLFSLSQKFSSYTQNALIAPSGAVFSAIFGWLLADQMLATSQLLGMFIVVFSVGIASFLNIVLNKKGKQTSDKFSVENDLEKTNTDLTPAVA